MCYYESYGRFTAEWGNEFHGNCVVSRQNTAAARMKGRPCGFMASWLMEGAFVSTEEELWGHTGWKETARGVRLWGAEETSRQ